MSARRPPASALQDSAAPLSATEFAALMAPLGPFETRPALAVAVSGGADSMALCLLADDWVRARGGSVTALTVDHGLRPEASAEAQRVAAWLGPRGIAHETLIWRPPPDTRNIQAAARAARHALLRSWCDKTGCLHLLTAHHLDDQAETFLLRLARGSGLDGLAAMAALRETPECRLVHPLLTVPHRRLVSFLRAAGQDWIEDPSNVDPRYARVRLRRGTALLADEGLSPARLAATTRRLGRARAALEVEVGRVLARAIALHPGGFARLDTAKLFSTTPEIALRALAQLIATIGGADYTPRLERLERLGGALARPLAAGRTLTGRTLGGCRFLPWRGTILVCREPAAVAPALPLPPGVTIHWDRRFSARLAASAPSDLSIGPLGDFRDDPALKKAAACLPGAVRSSLPAIHDLVGIAAVPHLHYVRSGREGIANDIVALSFRPERSLTGPGFTVV
jgi:tRNA(Ile)-lysidine synthase